MKKLLSSVTLAFASLASFNGLASAGHTFGLIVHHHCCGGCCAGTICLRQYNAFSPVACGSMVFQGCVTQPAPGPYGFDGGVGGDCSDGSCSGGVPVSQMQLPAPGAAYTYGPTMQMPQMAQSQMPAQPMPVMSYPAAPVQVTQPAAARVP
jgi:hypothetical protein